MAIVQILEKYYEGLSTDVKPTGVIAGSTFRETDTRRNWITYNGDDWVVADVRFRLVNEDGTYVDIPDEFDSLIEAIEALGAIVALQATLLLVQTAVGTVNTIVTAIKVKTDAMGILTQANTTVTTDGTEQTAYINNAPAGPFEPKHVKINVTAHTATETITIKEYYRNASGGAWLLHDSKQYVGAIAMDEITVKLDDNRYGVKVTIKKDAGTNRAYVCEAMYKVVP